MLFLPPVFSSLLTPKRTRVCKTPPTRSQLVQGCHWPFFNSCRPAMAILVYTAPQVESVHRAVIVTVPRRRDCNSIIYYLFIFSFVKRDEREWFENTKHKQNYWSGLPSNQPNPRPNPHPPGTSKPAGNRDYYTVYPSLMMNNTCLILITQ